MSEPITTPENAAPEGQEPPAQATSEPDWKAEARKWEQRAKDNAAKLKEATPQLAELAQIKQERMSVEQRQAEDLNRWQTEAQTWRSAALSHRIEALAAPDFAYPADAVGKLDPAKYIDAGGVINEAAIRADLAELLEERPNWRRGQDATPNPRIPAPNPAQGSGGGRPVASPAQEFASFIQGQLRS